MSKHLKIIPFVRSDEALLTSSAESNSKLSSELISVRKALAKAESSLSITSKDLGQCRLQLQEKRSQLESVAREKDAMEKEKKQVMRDIELFC